MFFFISCGCDILTGLFANESQCRPDGLALRRVVATGIVLNNFVPEALSSEFIMP